MNILLINLPSSSKLVVMGGDSFYQLQILDWVTSRFHSLHFTAFAYPDEWDILCHSGLVQACSKPSFFTSYPRAFDGSNHQGRTYGYTRANSGTIVSYDALSVLLTGCQLALSKGQTTTLTPNQVQTGLENDYLHAHLSRRQWTDLVWEKWGRHQQSNRSFIR